MKKVQVGGFSGRGKCIKALLSIDRTVDESVGSHQSKLKEELELYNYWLFLLSKLMGQCLLSAKLLGEKKA